jgi:hypothetical protein
MITAGELVAFQHQQQQQQLAKAQDSKIKW